MYIANSYIGTDYTPGEVLPDGMDEKLIERLLKTGAIRKGVPDPDPAQPVKRAEAPKAEKPAEKADADEAEEDDEEAEPEPPEVDAAAAIVQDTEEKPKAPRKCKGGNNK